MNTPAHVVLNALVLGRGRWRSLWLPISVGALAPDLPMLGFYAYERLLRGTPEHVLWSQAYFEPSWQQLFDLFNSLPLIGLGALLAWRLGSRAGLAFAASMALHCLADLPLHHEDAHAHFRPFSDWHFRSPISYWDPRRSGTLFLVLESVLVLGGTAALVWRRRERAWRWVGALALALYGGVAAFALAFWLGA